MKRIIMSLRHDDDDDDEYDNNIVIRINIHYMSINQSSAHSHRSSKKQMCVCSVL